MTAIFNSLFWPVSLSTRHKVPLTSFCRPPIKDAGSILHQSPNFYSTKNSLQYPRRLVDLFTVAANGSLCILLACMDASAVPSSSINSNPLQDSQSLNIAMDMDMDIPHQWGIENIIYAASAPELAMSMKKKENVRQYTGNDTRCPQWNLNEYETVVPILPRKPNSKLFPRHSYYWISVHNQANPSLLWNPHSFYRADSFARPGGTGNIQTRRPPDGKMLGECFSL